MPCERIPNGIICYNNEVDSDGLDLRTRKGNEEHVLRQVRTYGCFTIFWVTDNLKRAHAAQRLHDSGKIIPVDRPYPHCGYRIKGE